MLTALFAAIRSLARAVRAPAGALPPDVEAAIAGERPALAQQRGSYRVAQLVASDGRLVHTAPAAATPDGGPLVVYSSWHERLSGDRGLGGPEDGANPSLLAAEAYARAFAAAQQAAGDGEAHELWRGWEHIDGRAVGAVELAVGEPQAEQA
ncbi:MAG: hypothetical protein EXR63_00195 [Dehalococcoidia bacterium]|nr:hypothetical protein [Dehalococcoidia bacterium]